jgi:hypothetical protein
VSRRQDGRLEIWEHGVAKCRKCAARWPRVRQRNRKRLTTQTTTNLRALPDAVRVQLLAQSKAGEAQSTGGLGLVALREEDGLGNDLTLGLAQDLSVGVAQFAALRTGEQRRGQGRQRVDG